MGIGAGAVILGPIAQILVKEAHGATTARKRAVFVLQSNGLPSKIHAPAGVAQGREGGNTFKQGEGAVLPGLRDFAWPKFVAPLEPYRNKMLLIDGLANRVSGEHSGGFGGLSAFNVTRGTGQDDGPPGGITIDQHIANGIGRHTPIKSLLWGVADAQAKLMIAKVFASGRERALPHHVTPAGLWSRLFASSGAASPDTAHRRRLLLDPLRQDIAAMRIRLAPTERRALEHYLEVIKDFEDRVAMLQPVSCEKPAAPAMNPTVIEDRIMMMNEMSILAVTCGITNVVGVSLSCGNGHSAPAYNRIQKGTTFEGEGKMDFHGHDTTYDASMEIIFSFVSSVVARMAEAWSKVKEGDQTIFDNSTVFMASDSAENHHARKERWPFVLVGNAGGALKADGRYLRYPALTRGLCDAFSSIATAVGVPTDTFGLGGAEVPKGPLSEISA